MAYVVPDFTSKAAMKRAVTAGDVVTVYSPGPFGCVTDGVEFIEGPHYPKPHTWYAKVQVSDGCVVKVLA
ncbi:MAG: hypothetical protein JWM85_3604 [Acidimicrobiaceae bacterium]|nr:hypothetical protein [Acidimicrobiaceae bacterium]